MALLGYIIYGLLLFSQANSTKTCRCFPGDTCWPNKSTWDRLNSTVGGRLVKTIPLGSPCHDSTFGPYDEARCQVLKDEWFNPELHINTTSSVMAPFFAIRSCNPFLPRNASCVVGSYVQYSVDAKDEGDYKAAIKFARNYNIRLVIRNTAHDWLGKSGGAGALAIRTHNLKNTDVVDYNSSYYTGKALKVGAGVSLMEAFQASHQHGCVNVGGTSPTLGIAGGYTQGTGHGLTVSAFGLGADQALEWEVMTAEERTLRATPEENPDLYWALSGGGGGTYAVVLSLTIKIHKDGVTSALNMAWSTDTISQDMHYAGIKAFAKTLPTILDSGVGGNWLNSNTSFSISPFVGVGKTKQDVDTIFEPLLLELKELNISYSYYSAEFPTFLDMYKKMNPTTEMGIFQIGSRLIPREVIDTSPDDFVGALQRINKQGAWISGLAYNASRAPMVPNAVNPAWRSSIVSLVIGAFYDYQNWDVNVANQRLMTQKLISEISKIVPGAASAYLNEGDPWEPEWQQVFYGENYDRLLEIKRKYDLESALYARTAVGSEAWVEGTDGRLCRA